MPAAADLPPIARWGETLLLLVALVGAGALLWHRYGHRLGPDRAVLAGERHAARLAAELGAPVYLRVFKEEAELELWLEEGGAWSLFRTYPICTFSGELGPKTREGDRQSPEGLYAVTRDRLNPWSRFHLSFDLGFPNPAERARGWTGSALMIHGDCVSIGCYAMGDAAIEEIYLLVEAALDAGQDAVPVHAFPFRMTPDALAAHADSPWAPFWAELEPAFTWFETRGAPPAVTFDGAGYVVEAVGSEGGD